MEVVRKARVRPTCRVKLQFNLELKRILRPVPVRCNLWKREPWTTVNIVHAKTTFSSVLVSSPSMSKMLQLTTDIENSKRRRKSITLLQVVSYHLLPILKVPGRKSLHSSFPLQL